MSIISSLTDTARETFEVLSVPETAVHKRIHSVESYVRALTRIVEGFEPITEGAEHLFTTEYTHALENHLIRNAVRPDLLQPSILKEVKVPHSRSILDSEVSVITDSQIDQMASVETGVPEFQTPSLSVNDITLPAEQEAELQTMIGDYYVSEIDRLEAVANNVAMTMDEANAHIAETAQQY